MAVDWQFIGILAGNIVTLGSYAMLVGENPVSKFVEHLYFGVMAGYLLVINWQSIYNQGILKIAEQPYYIIPIILIVMLYFRLNKNTVWIYRYPMALIIGVGVGLSVRATIFSQFLDQIKGTLPPANPLVGVPLGTGISNLIIVIGTMVVAIYFIFTREFKGPMKQVHKLGRYFLLIAFGATYGSTVIYRYELLSGSLLPLVTPGVIWYSAAFAVVILGILAWYYKTGRGQWETH